MPTWTKILIEEMKEYTENLEIWFGNQMSFVKFSYLD